MVKSFYLTSTVGSFPQPSKLRQARNELKSGKITRGEYLALVRGFAKECVDFQKELGIDVMVRGEFERDDMAAYFGEFFGGRRLGFVRSYENRWYRPIEYSEEIKHPGDSFLQDDFLFLKSAANGRMVKETITGPATMADWAIISSDEYYRDRRLFRLDFARALKKEIEMLLPAGLEILQVDEPALTTSMDNFEMDFEALNAMLAGLRNKLYLILHICFSNFDALDMAMPAILKLPFHQIHMEMANRNYSLLSLIEKYSFGGKDIGLGVIDVHNGRVESVEEIVEGVKKIKGIKGPNGQKVFRPDQIWLTPDCGLKTGGHEFSEQAVKDKLSNMVTAAKICRDEAGVDN